MRKLKLFGFFAKHYKPVVYSWLVLNTILSLAAISSQTTTADPAQELSAAEISYEGSEAPAPLRVKQDLTPAEEGVVGEIVSVSIVEPDYEDSFIEYWSFSANFENHTKDTLTAFSGEFRFEDPFGNVVFRILPEVTPDEPLPPGWRYKSEFVMDYNPFDDRHKIFKSRFKATKATWNLDRIITP